MPLNRDQILGAKDYRIDSVEVPEWGGKVNVRTFDGRARDRIEAAAVAGEASEARLMWRALIARLSVCDEAGNLLFTDADLDGLARRSAFALTTVAEAALRLNRMTAQEEAVVRSDFSGTDGAGLGSG